MGLLTTPWSLFFLRAVYPPFFSLFVSQEWRSSVQAMQLSNDLANPVGLWLGHLIFDSLVVHDFHHGGRRHNFLCRRGLPRLSRVPGVRTHMERRWNRVLNIFLSGLSWSSTGLLQRCGHTVFLHSCLHLWLPSLSSRVTK